MAGTEYYNSTGAPATSSSGSSSTMRAEFDLIEAGFDKLPALATNAYKAVVVNAGSNGLTVTDGNLGLAGNFSTVGAYNAVLTFTGATAVTFPTTGTLLTNTTIGSVVNAATGKTTPVDADELALSDSAASWGLKKLTWANLKATLKTYFDTLYQAAGSYLTSGGALGTPSSGTLTNCTGTASGLTAGNVTTNANLTGEVTSVGNAATIATAAVTLAKMADLAQDQFIGRTTASTGVPETATITAAARTVLDDTTVSAMVDTLGGASASGTGGLARRDSPSFKTALTLDANASALQTPPTGTLFHLGGTDATAARMTVDGHGSFVTFSFRRAQGTAASPTNVTSGQTLGSMNAFAYGATGYSSTARVAVNFSAAEAWTDSAQGANVSFQTTPAGSTSIATIATITDVGNVKIGGTANRATTEGTKHIDIFDGTAPVGTLANGISIYSTSGECYIMDAAGNATLQSPHDKETNEWIFYSKNTRTGKVLKIDMERMMRKLNDTLGGGFISEFTEEVK